MQQPTGRAAKRAATARRIVEAAQVEFGEHGYERTTVRAVAHRAGVDPSLVMQHYGSKSDLFAIAAELRPDSTAGEVAEHLADVLKVRLGALPAETRTLVRSMLTSPQATSAMKTFLDERVRNLARTSDAEQAELRAAVAVSSVLGVTIARHFLELDALADLSETDIETIVQPWVGAAMDGVTDTDPDRRRAAEEDV